MQLSWDPVHTKLRGVLVKKTPCSCYLTVYPPGGHPLPTGVTWGQLAGTPGGGLPRVPDSTDSSDSSYSSDSSNNSESSDSSESSYNSDSSYSYGNFVEWVGFAYWWSFIGGGSSINGATPSCN